MLSAPLALALSLALSAAASPLSSSGDGLHIPLTRRALPMQDEDGRFNAAILGRNGTASELRKRASQALQYDGAALWSGPVTLGPTTSPQTFTVYFDTGSSDLGLPSYTCTSAACAAKKTYDWRASADPDARLTANKEIASVWADGSQGSGKIVKTTVTAGGLTATGQDVMALSAIASAVSDRNTDGMGLAYRTMSAGWSYAFPFTLAQQGQLPTFGLRLSPTPGQSAVTFAGYNRAKVASTIRWMPVTISDDSPFRTYWQVGGSGLMVNGTLATPRDMFVFDTGSTAIIGPSDWVESFWASVPDSRAEGDGYYSYPCVSPPTVSLSLARVTRQLHAIHPD
ncbi:hypothetical protein JCM10207_004538, partial [Rhodosporidiobolus poonsookiae]